MHKFIPILFVFVLFYCSPPAKKENNDVGTLEREGSNTDGDQYLLVLRYIDNRALVHIDDSVIYDSETVAGAFNIEIDLSPYVAEGKTELRVDLYNGRPPYNTTDSHWELAYDIYVNGELADFVREGERDGRIGNVFSETHYLDDIW